MKRVFRRLIILFALSTVSIYAQRDLGTITGMVTDPQGTVVPNAKVTYSLKKTLLVFPTNCRPARRVITPDLFSNLVLIP